MCFVIVHSFTHQLLLSLAQRVHPCGPYKMLFLYKELTVTRRLWATSENPRGHGVVGGRVYFPMTGFRRNRGSVTVPQYPGPEHGVISPLGAWTRLFPGGAGRGEGTASLPNSKPHRRTAGKPHSGSLFPIRTRRGIGKHGLHTCNSGGLLGGGMLAWNHKT